MKYLHPSFNNIQDWSALDNIEDACYLLKKHIDNNSKIGIIVDVDVDGTTSAATLWNFIKRIKPGLQIEAIIHEKKMHGLTDDLYEDVYHNNYNKNEYISQRYIQLRIFRKQCVVNPSASKT